MISIDVPAAAPQAQHAPAAVPRVQHVTVRPGDTLYGLARRLLGDGGKWPRVYAENAGVIGSDPNFILPGQQYTVERNFGGSAPVAVPARTTASSSTARGDGDDNWDSDGGHVAGTLAPSTVSGVSTASVQGGGSIVADVQMVFGSGAGCAEEILNHESGLAWADVTISNPGSGAYGLPQALPGDKMASAGADWQTNPVTQLRWMLGYVNSTYGGVCPAAAHDLGTGTY